MLLSPLVAARKDATLMCVSTPEASSFIFSFLVESFWQLFLELFRAVSSNSQFWFGDNLSVSWPIALLLSASATVHTDEALRCTFEHFTRLSPFCNFGQELLLASVRANWRSALWHGDNFCVISPIALLLSALVSTRKDNPGGVCVSFWRFILHFPMLVESWGLFLDFSSLNKPPIFGTFARDTTRKSHFRSNDHGGTCFHLAITSLYLRKLECFFHLQIQLAKTKLLVYVWPFGAASFPFHHGNSSKSKHVQPNVLVSGHSKSLGSQKLAWSSAGKLEQKDSDDGLEDNPVSTRILFQLQ